jgi:CRISPR system Cascade subunit CasC
MSDKNFLTIHSLTALPWHNLNRDDRGLPKQVREGGKTRGRLSAQSLKRAIRVAFELESATPTTKSLRSRNLADEVVRRAAEITTGRGVQFDEKAAQKTATKIIKSLTANAVEEKVDAAEKDDAAPANSDTITWLSGEEIDALANAIAEGGGTILAKDIIKSTTGSLALASFGRMFAAQSDLQTEASIAVGPATTTHPITIEVDYFTTVDDLDDHGAGHLGQAFFTSGVYYRSVTIDKKQLKNSWTGWNSPDATERLSLLVRCIITALPTGKDNSSAPNTKPAIIIAEEQAHRTAYDFQEPVKAAPEGGYLQPSISRLISQATAARAFDAGEFGATFVSGTSLFAEDSDMIPFDHSAGDLGQIVEAIVKWLQR